MIALHEKEAVPATGASPPELDHLSWSSISTYKACPRKFAFRKIEKAPEERRSAALPFGSALHRAVERIHQARLEGASQPSVEELLTTYEETWSEVTAEGPEIVFGKQDNPTSLKELAIRMLTAYLQHVAGQPQTTVLSIEHQERFRLLPGVPPLEARVDRVELCGHDLVVTDTKTSKCRWNDVKELENRGQLVLYAFGLVRTRNAMGAIRIAPQFEVLTKAKKPVVQVVELVVTREDALRVRDEVGQTWEAIKARVFPRRESWACNTCPYRVACLGR